MSIMNLTNLRCEYLTNPLGIDQVQPRLSWQLAAAPGERGVAQRAYQVLTASTRKLMAADKGDLWDSGKVVSQQNTHVEYAGKKLASRQRCWWKVRVWDAAGDLSSWSEVATWEMGLLRKTDWQAKWIAGGIDTQRSTAGPATGTGIGGLPLMPTAQEQAKEVQSPPCPHLRKSFALRGPVAKARAYVSALGLYELWLNGRRVGEDFFTPGWTDYNIRVQYQTYDVTSLLQSGANAVGAVLGEGWCCGNLGWAKNRGYYAQAPRFLLQLEIVYADGGTETVQADSSWKCSLGPILASDIYNGETYDQRLEIPGWSGANFDDSAWAPVKQAPPAKGKLVASASPRVRKQNELTPVALTEPSPGAYLYDLGQNMVGWVKLQLPPRLPKGTTVMLRHGEVLNPDGTLYTANLRSAKATDRITIRGMGRGMDILSMRDTGILPVSSAVSSSAQPQQRNGEDMAETALERTGGTPVPQATFEPHFTFHGFRYVELTGLPIKPTLETVRGVVLHSATPTTGKFECSSPLLNKLQSNITWGQKGNFLEVPTDCPQRDERMGWTGDAQVFIRTACYNTDVAAFFTKWLTDMADSQSPAGAFPMVSPDVIAGRKGDGGAAWADAGIICPWTIYLCYGDTRILQRHYKEMARYIAFQSKVDWSTRHCFGDWLNIDDPTPTPLIGYAFWAYTTAIMIEVATILGLKKDAASYRRLLAHIKGEFAKEFITPRGRLASLSQTGYILALHFDLLPERLRPVIARRLVDHIHSRQDHLATGFVGTPYLLSVLSEAGELDLAYKLLLNEDYPSWGYPITQGATTMWEHWNSYHHEKGFQRPSMNSFNHYAYGAVGDWMYRNIGGIDLDPRQAGYKHLVIRPRIGGGLTWAKASLHTINGLAACEWKLTGKKLVLNITVPPNSTATVHVPTNKISGVTESGKSTAKAPGVKFVKYADGAAVFEIGSGEYSFAT